MPKTPHHSGEIEIHLGRLSQLYESLDPSPFWDKDLDADAEEYIVSCARDLPREAPLRLVISVDSPPVPEQVEDAQQAVHAQFARRAASESRRLRALLRMGRTAMLIGLAWLAASIVVGDVLKSFDPESPLLEIISQSLLIGGWVAMWRPLEIFLYEWWPITREIRMLDRMSRMPVEIVPSGAQPGAA